MSATNDNGKLSFEKLRQIENLQYNNSAQLVQVLHLHSKEEEEEYNRSQPFFESPKYLELAGKRPKTYSKPYSFTFYSEPSRETLASPYYHEFSNNIGVIGYMKPNTVPQPSDPSQYEQFLKSYCVFDKPWGQFPKSPAIQKALNLTRKLFTSTVRADCAVLDLSLSGKFYMGPQLKLRRPSGLPFCKEPKMQLQAACVDRGFKLAEEIDAELRGCTNIAKVTVPPCLLYSEGYSGPCTGMYPMAIEIIEKRFSLMTISTFSREQDICRTPLNLGIMPRHIALEVLPNITRGSFYGCTLQFKDLETSVHPDLVDFAFAIMYVWSTVESEFSLPRENRMVFEFIKNYYKQTPVLLPSGQLVYKRGGGLTPGSEFTPFVSGIATTFVLVYCMLNQGVDPASIARHLFVRDAEAAFSVPKTFSTEQLVKDAKDLGYTIDEKSIRFSPNASDLRYCDITTKSNLRLYPDHEGPVWHMGPNGVAFTTTPHPW